MDNLKKVDEPQIEINNGQMALFKYNVKKIVDYIYN